MTMDEVFSFGGAEYVPWVPFSPPRPLVHEAKIFLLAPRVSGRGRDAGLLKVIGQGRDELRGRREAEGGRQRAKEEEAEEGGEAR